MKTNYNFRALIFIALFFPAFVFAQTAKEPGIGGIGKAKDSDYNAAIQEYDKALQLDSNNATIYFNRGIAKAKLNDYLGAIADYTKSNAIKPSADTYFNSGFAKYKAAKLTGAIEDFDKVIEMNPSPPAEVYFYRGNIKFMNSDYFSAIKEFGKAIEINPDYAKAFFNRGLSEHNLNQKEESCKDFTKAKELGYAEAQAALTKYCNISNP
jgi:tetratricopeptide (TPR) repeat protein